MQLLLTLAANVAPFDFAAWQEACQSMFPKTLANLLEGKPAKMPKRFVETWQGFDHLPREQKLKAMSEVGLYIVMHYPPRGELSPEQDFLMQLHDELRRRRRRGSRIRHDDQRAGPHHAKTPRDTIPRHAETRPRHARDTPETRRIAFGGEHRGITKAQRGSGRNELPGDDNGLPFWPKPDGSLLKDLKADLGWALAIDDRGNLLRRRINGTCCHDPVSPVHCWCAEVAPRFSAVADNGEHGLGFYFPWLQHKHGDTWTASANRWLKQLTTRDDGHNAASPNEISQYFSSHCMVDMDHCAALDTTIQDFLKSWRKETHEEWKVWDWDMMKRAYSTCTQSTQICQRPMKHYGAFREKFMRHTFCCARHLQTPEDPRCLSQVCKAYDITCPGSKLLTSDMDCTVYHSRDPGTLIKNMTRLATAKLQEYTGRPADLGVVFDLSLFGTWTWIPDEIFRRFDWPSSTKDADAVRGRRQRGTSLNLWREEMALQHLGYVWVFRRKCRPTSRQAIYDKVKRIIRDGQDVHAADLENLTINLKSFVGNLANGAYGSGNSLRDWDKLYQDYHAVSSVQREGYLTYAATLEIVGRQQVGLPTTFAEDYQCMRQVSFLEQLAFIAQHIHDDVPHGISEHTWRKDIQMMLLKSGKYFDRLLEVDGPGYDEGLSIRRHITHADNSVLWRVLGSVYGGTHLHQVLHDLYGVQSVRDAASSLSMMSTSAFDNAEVRRRSCMDIAMWGNAVRHKEAFRRDTGELTRPMVTALFTCLVHPNCTEGTTTVKEAMLHTVEVWVDSVPGLEVGGASGFGKAPWAWLLLAAMSLALIAFAMLRKRRAMTPKHRHPFEVNFEIKHS
ncbi:unnamed protein product [Cladocopium goreaui]|uniref:Serine/threonine-protein phosphatase n=1 Tax=Cladocopium goreaui TaxID=2562237 RepID=A0A9P1DQG9_9DINO|nr:unnamed protein product [Cladocopium goreaui]